MTKIKLTKTTVEDLAFAEKGKQVDYYDCDLDGFGIRVSHTGKKYFVRRTIGAKRVRVMVGSHPVKSAEAARKEARIALGVMESGVDPNEQKRERVRSHQAEQLEITVEELVTRYIEQHAKVEKKTWMEDRRCLVKEVVPLWGKRKAKDIRKRDVVVLLDKIKERAPVMANNTFEKIRKMFNFAVEKDILEISPCYMVKKPTKTESKDRTLSVNEISNVWHGLNRTGMTDELKRALRLILVTGQRPGEVIGLHTREIEGDWWTIPKERSKNGREHRVFLTHTSLQLIGEKQGYVFESPCGGKGMDVNAVAYAVRRNIEVPTSTIPKEGEVIQEEADRENAYRKKLVMQTWTPHDLRRTAATNISELGYPDEVVDAILNHAKKGVIGTYNRNKYDKEKKRALTSWERRLKAIIAGGQSSSIPELR
jgi:integrase